MLLGRQVAQVVRAEADGGEGAAVWAPQLDRGMERRTVAMLEDDRQPARWLGEDRQDSVVEEGEAVCAAGLAAVEDVDRAARSVVLSVEPCSSDQPEHRVRTVAQGEGRVVGVVEMVDRNLERVRAIRRSSGRDARLQPQLRCLPRV